MRDLVAHVAADEGYRTVEARTGPEALEAFAAACPDAVLVDVVLPRLDGLQVCERLKSTPEGALIPVLVMSGVYRNEREAMRSFGADGFLLKPFMPDALRKRLAGLFPSSALVREEEAEVLPEPGEQALGEHPFAFLLAEQWRSRSTGVFRVRTRGVDARVSLLQGNIVGVEASAWAEDVQTLVLRSGRLTSAQQGRLAQKPLSPADFERRLVAEGYLTASELTRVGVVQRSHRVLEMCRWTDGAARFAPSPIDDARATDALDTLAVLRLGLWRTCEDERYFSAVCGSTRTPMRLHAASAQALGRLTLGPVEKALLASASGERSFNDIVARAAGQRAVGRGEWARAATVLAALGALSSAPENERPAVVPVDIDIDIDIEEPLPSTVASVPWDEESEGTWLDVEIDDAMADAVVEDAGGEEVLFDTSNEAQREAEADALSFELTRELYAEAIVARRLAEQRLRRLRTQRAQERALARQEVGRLREEKLELMVRITHLLEDIRRLTKDDANQNEMNHDETHVADGRQSAERPSARQKDRGLHESSERDG